MTVEQICKALKCGLFADRDTIQDAQEYVADICNSLPPEYKMGVYTAIGVLLNTVAKELEKREGSIFVPVPETSNDEDE